MTRRKPSRSSRPAPTRRSRIFLQNLEALRADFADVTGTPFTHFHCPFLQRDEPAELCRGHIVNSAFSGSDRRWTVMRKDVDEFFGSVCESDFVLMQERGRHNLVDIVADRELSRKLLPAIIIGGKVVPHYLPTGTVPPEHSELTLERPGHAPFRIALKRQPSELFAGGGVGWEIRVAKDVRTPALTSLLKAAHLSMFSLLGYSYALSPGGRFIGHDLLGKFFDDCNGLSRRAALAEAGRRFMPYANLLRPIAGGADSLRGTITDGVLFWCGGGEHPWAMVTLVRTGATLHAVLIPTLDSPSSIARFEEFVDAPTAKLDVRHVRIHGSRWEVSRQRSTFDWPASGAA